MEGWKMHSRTMLGFSNPFCHTGAYSGSFYIPQVNNPSAVIIISTGCSWNIEML